MSLAYAPRGLVGMLSAAGNTTVEPIQSALAAGCRDDQRAAYQRQDTMSERLIDYFESYAASLRQFANAP